MTPTMHKVLMHGPEIIKNALPSIGLLSEEALEARNKHFRKFREGHSRNVLEIYQNTNIEEVEMPIENFKDNLVLRLTKNYKGFNKSTKDIFYDNFHLNLMRPRILVHGPFRKCEVMMCFVDRKKVFYLMFTDHLLDKLDLKNLFISLENLKLLCLEYNLYELSFVKEDYKKVNYDQFINMIRYIFEGTNIKISVITPEEPARVNISLSFRKFRSFNKRNVIENKNYIEHNNMIFNAERSVVCFLPLNLEDPSELLSKYDFKYNHFNELRSEIESNNIKLGDIVVKKHKDQNVYYMFFKDNEWDNKAYDELYDIVEQLKHKLQSNQEKVINLPTIENSFQNLSWDKIRVMIKYIFHKTDIFVNVYRNLIINPNKEEIKNIIKEFHSNVTWVIQE